MRRRLIRFTASAMVVALPFALVLQAVSVQVGTSKAREDSARRAAVRDSIRAEMINRSEDNRRRPVRRIPVTPDLERSAFKDPDARQLLLRARAARFEQDSTLLSYDATAYQRISAGLGFRAIGRDRLLFRSENATRVRWSRSGGVYVDLKGRRTVFPMVDEHSGDVNMDEIGPIPYFPGREALWVGSGLARAEVDENELVHPIATGAEAYYRYEAGDSLTITLSDGKAIRLRELRIEPRRPEWKFSVGSFWFDQESGRLVRAVYRMAAPMNIWAVADEESARERAERHADAAGDTTSRGRRRNRDDDDDVPGWVKGMMSPMEANLEAVTVEYGLYGGRYWLPQTQYAEGYAKASFMRVPFKLEESFKYASVNGTDSLPTASREKTYRELRDSLFGHDSTRWMALAPDVRAARTKELAALISSRAAARAERRKAECAADGFYTATQSRFDGAVRATVRTPCDTAALARAPELSPSIYDAGEDLFGVTERNELLKALDFSLQPVWAPMPVQLDYGLSHLRYNRVEGLSFGARASQVLGKGYSWGAEARAGTADHSLYGDLSVSRTNGRHTWRVGGYRRLGVANSDWGNPLSFGASLGAALYGRDEGYFYRASGMELERALARGGGLSMKAFLEREHNATANTTWNVSRAFGGRSEFQPNITTERATVAGIALRNQLNRGLDPLGWRLYGDARLEGGLLLDRALGDTAPGAYGRAAGDLTISRAVGPRFAAALTLGAGYSHGAPVQRQFFLGGAQTVRGQLLGSAAGEAYWLGRLEMGHAVGAVRPVLFGDVGWAGPWAQRSHPGRPISGVGLGTSVLDGLIRLDLSRGLHPRKRNRLDLYVEARF
ncbi:MAG: hypothetical protein IT361_05105 [Gemmatimonadaceae bacterium]|nr:hypothetical protein [Gemmatimonadaceae bacterium]